MPGALGARLDRRVGARSASQPEQRDPDVAGQVRRGELDDWHHLAQRARVRAVHQHHVVRAVFEQGVRLGRGRHVVGLDTPPRQLLGQDRAVRLVGDHQCPPALQLLPGRDVVRSWPADSAPWSRTTVQVKTLPPPGLAAYSRVPPIAATSSLEMARPSPVPP